MIRSTEMHGCGETATKDSLDSLLKPCFLDVKEKQGKLMSGFSIYLTKVEICYLFLSPKGPIAQAIGPFFVKIVK